MNDVEKVLDGHIYKEYDFIKRMRKQDTEMPWKDRQLNCKIVP